MPPDKLLINAVFCTPGFQSIEYGSVPPAMVACAFPFAAPNQVTFVLVGIVTTGAATSFTFATLVTLHP